MHIATGLEFGRVRPSDRLHEDLQLSLICWYDWEVSFCDAFSKAFEAMLEPDFNPDEFDTVADLVLFLNSQILSVNHF
jgi:hypothetical protein